MPVQDELLNTDSKYMALSHCWGTTLQPIKLARESLEEMKIAIPLEQIPKTFREAMTLTRELGAQYIWIDSLCIIKDDKFDWEKESAKMAAVYENAHLTIAAVASANAEGGCIQDYEPTDTIHFPVDPDLPQLAKYSTCQLRIESSEEYALFQSPLYSRGWTLQELILSPRILLCCKDQLFWQCRTDIYSEDCLVRIPRRFSTLPSRDEYITQHSIWWSWVEQYSRRNLTDPQDKMAALAGLTSNAAVVAKDEPVAGMWAGQLPTGLLWTAPEYVKRGQLYLAPTWSWISVDGPVKMPADVDMKAQIRPNREAEVKAWLMSWQRQPLTSPIMGVKLSLVGRIQQARVEDYTFRGRWQLPRVFEGGKQPFDLLSSPPLCPPFRDGFRGVASFDTGPVQIGSTVTCLQIGFTYPQHLATAHRGLITTAHHYFLILAPRGSAYQRLGMGYVAIETQKWSSHDKWGLKNRSFPPTDEKLLLMADNDMPNDGSWSGFLDSAPKVFFDLV